MIIRSLRMAVMSQNVRGDGLKPSISETELLIWTAYSINYSQSTVEISKLDSLRQPQYLLQS
jgi:hypothetical protein